MKDRFSSNWELSTARATAVAHFLSQAGVPAENRVAAGYAEFKPVASNKTASGRQKNRRIEIVLLPEEVTQISLSESEIKLVSGLSP